MAEKSGALGVSCRGRYLVCGGCRAIREGAARASLKPEKDVHRLQVAEVGRDEERGGALECGLLNRSGRSGRQNSYALGMAILRR